ncbi:hypothetical protein Plim_2010 [Planctopirus limnophila DSM 3776]|uniref:Uncharacterized protein n=1 Tax=Planctopirus limnophila (strain ATCC 43296 / DSM 3776 / IFAM 1008 / Mu 290) TaxID=521674 RepID=D5SYQ7_PLAL2|nr:hypothetical protein [Planctopirus limnophila]ADG67839.1 hypothetical protein Plim_2010 [Planctopirus limnophila DSM 3776]
MAKKQSAMTPPKPASSPEASGKARVELRFDADVLEKIRKLSEDAQISVNQLMHGLARWATENVHPGEPYFIPGNKFVQVKRQPGVVWAGKDNFLPSEEEKQEYLAMTNGESSLEDKEGEVYFILDFTERRVVREDF